MDEENAQGAGGSLADLLYGAVQAAGGFLIARETRASDAVQAQQNAAAAITQAQIGAAATTQRYQFIALAVIGIAATVYLLKKAR